MHALIETHSHEFLKGFEEKRRFAIVAEARRLHARRSTIPFYVQKEQMSGPALWLGLAISYAGDD